jgi:hypothetical protein
MIARRLLSLLWAFALLVAVLAVARRANAQTFSRLDPGQQTVTAETGLQSGVVTSLGYATGLRLPAIDRTLMPFAQVGMLVAKPDLHDYACRVGAQMCDAGRELPLLIAAPLENATSVVRRQMS